MPRLTPLGRFVKQVQRDERTGCWMWTGATKRQGYGQFTVSSTEQTSAHRFAYTHFVGPIPEGASVLHTCDTPGCVNPEHLWLGTTADNLADMRAKGRDRVVEGEDHYNAKLTEDDIRVIRARYTTGGTTQRALAKEYGVTQSNISHIVRGSSWKRA